MDSYGGSSCWVTKDGRIIPFEEIEDDHLKAIFNMLRRKRHCNLMIFLEMIRRGFWDADPGVISRICFRAVLQGVSTTRNGSFAPV